MSRYQKYCQRTVLSYQINKEYCEHEYSYRYERSLADMLPGDMPSSVLGASVLLVFIVLPVVWNVVSAQMEVARKTKVRELIKNKEEELKAAHPDWSDSEVYYAARSELNVQRTRFGEEYILD